MCVMIITRWRKKYRAVDKSAVAATQPLLLRATQTRGGCPHAVGDDNRAPPTAAVQVAIRQEERRRNIFMEVVRFCLLEIKSVPRLYHTMYIYNMVVVTVIAFVCYYYYFPPFFFVLFL